jgi:hypothetical protein
MKKCLILISLFLVLLFANSQNVSAQTQKLLVFKKGVAIVTSTIKGDESKTYFFKVKKDTDMEIFIDEQEKRPKFTLFKPNGKLFYDDTSVNRGDAFDLMDILEDAGTYKIVVKLPEDLQGETKPIKFTLRLVLR